MANYKKYAIVDLHLHLDGSLSPEIVIDVAKKENIKLPTYDKDELRHYLEVPEDCGSLNEYLERFALPNLVLQSKEGIYLATLDLLKRNKEQGIKYVEIRMAPQLSTQNGLNQTEVVQALLKARTSGEILGIKSNFILCMMRLPDAEEKNNETIRVAKDFLGKGVVALDLAGAEALFPNEMFKNQFALAIKLGIPFTIHAGEASGADSVISALAFNPIRIGHGVRSVENKDLLKTLKNKGVILEICPTSNIDTKTFKKYEEIPLKEFMKSGVKFCINTDDSTVSNTTLENEYKILSDLGYSNNDLKLFALNSIDAAFISEKEKDELRQLIL